MRTWTAIGAIFFLIALLLLVIGFVQGIRAVQGHQATGQSPNTGNSILSQLGETAFWSAGGLFIISSLIFFIIGGVGLYAGREPEQITVKVEPDLPTVQSISNEQGASQIRCGSCGTLNDLDAFFCKRCGKRFR